MKKLAIIASALALSLAANAQQAQKLSASKANDYGLVYSLPTTALDVTIEAELTVRKPGEFAKYAAKYLNINNPILTPSSAVTVKSAVVNAVGIANAEEQYLISLKGGQSPFILISDENIPLAINTESVYTVEPLPVPTAQAAAPTPLETPAAQQVITQEMLQSHSSAKRAELAAEQIYALRQSRTEIITGQAEQMPPDGAAMQLVLDNINAQEQALLAMFIGTESVSTQVRTFRIVPEGDISNQVIARISVKNGIVEPTDLSGAPVYFSLSVTEQGELPVGEKGEVLPFPKGGVAYCIPGKATCSLRYDGKVIDSQEFEMAQFGVVYGMDPKGFSDKKEPLFLQFNPVTGAAAAVGPAAAR